MSRSYSEARAAWQAWLHIHSIDRDHPVGFVHTCGAMSDFDVEYITRAGVIICNGCRFEVKCPEKEASPVYPPSQARTGKAPKIRVLRVLEYIYDNAEIAALDMGRWTMSIPYSTGRMTMKSVTLPFETIEWESGGG